LAHFDILSLRKCCVKDKWVRHPSKEGGGIYQEI
jgi:hypothetical protein